MILGRYTIFTRIVLYRDKEGKYWTQELWEKDLTLHFDYIEDLRICCPVQPLDRKAGTVSHVPDLHDGNVLSLRRDGGWGSVLKNLIPNGRTVAKAIRRTDIAHSGGAGWAFPLSYYILPLRVVCKFSWIVVIESSFFRQPARGSFNLRRFLSHHLHTFLLRRCVAQADVGIFTSSAYYRIFRGHPEKSHIAPAIWIDADHLRDAATMPSGERSLDAKLRLVFPARLIADKGIGSVLDAIRILEDRLGDRIVARLRLDIVGKGPLADICRTFAERRPSGHVRFMPPVEYGPPFFDLLRNYDALLLANLTAEQPRIIFDAYSQGLSCIASATDGVIDIVEDGKTGLLYDPGNAQALADRIEYAMDNPDTLAAMGRAALTSISSRSHRDMHRQREIFLKSVLVNKNANLQAATINQGGPAQ